MIDQLNKQHKNLTCNEPFALSHQLVVEKGTTVSVYKGAGEWLEHMVKVIRVTLQTPYFDARLTLCDKEMGWDHLDVVAEDADYEDKAEMLAMKVLGHVSVKETLLMMHESYRYGVNHGKDLLRSDIKRLLHV